MPCNLNQRKLADYVKQGIRAAGGTPMEFNTIAVSDGVSMGTTRHARVARLARGDRGLDRARRARAPVRRPGVPRRLRQDDPGGGDGAGPARPPGPRPLRRLDRARPLPRPRRDDPGRLRGRRRARGRHDDREELHELESVACPGAGACGGQFTANTMAIALDFLGISPPGSTGSRRRQPGKAQAAMDAGELVMQLVERTRGRRRS